MTGPWSIRATSLVSSLALAALVAACGEGGISSPTLDGSSLAFDGSDDAFDGNHVTVCTDAGSPAGTYSFTHSASTTDGTFAVSSPFSVGAAVCVDVWKDDGAAGTSDPTTDVTITESSLPAGVQLDDITFSAGTESSGFITTSKNVAGSSATVTVNQFHGGVITFVHSLIPVTGDEGCTPGYWRQDHHFDSWPVPTNTLFNDVFTSSTLSGSLTLAEAVALRGGKLNALARAAAAAYLNAVSPDVDYAFTTAEVVSMVNDAFDGILDVETVKDDLDLANNGGDEETESCPLD